MYHKNTNWANSYLSSSLPVWLCSDHSSLLSEAGRLSLQFPLSFSPSLLLSLSVLGHRSLQWTASSCWMQWACVVPSTAVLTWRSSQTSCRPGSRWPGSTRTCVATPPPRGQPATGTTCPSPPEPPLIDITRKDWHDIWCHTFQVLLTPFQCFSILQSQWARTYFDEWRKRWDRGSEQSQHLQGVNW